MVWIKRNLYFVISSAVGLLLTGYCGFLLYGAFSANADFKNDWETTVNGLNDKEKMSPYPSKENINAAKQTEEKVRKFLAEFRTRFASFPTPPPKDDKQFRGFLVESIVQFRAGATNADVKLPPDYDFSFSSLKEKLNYSREDIVAWLGELQEMSTILDILYRAKINYLESICRVQVSPDDSGSGDCLLAALPANSWGTATPYRITFRGFSSEIAAVLEGFAQSSNCFIVDSIQVAPDTTVQQQAAMEPPPMQPQQAPPMYAPQPRMPSPRSPRFDREGPGGYRPAPPPRYAPAPNIPSYLPLSSAGPVTILSESPLTVTMSIEVVKLKSSEH